MRGGRRGTWMWISWEWSCTSCTTMIRCLTWISRETPQSYTMRYSNSYTGALLTRRQEKLSGASKTSWIRGAEWRGALCISAALYRWYSMWVASAAKGRLCRTTITTISRMSSMGHSMWSSYHRLLSNNERNMLTCGMCFSRSRKLWIRVKMNNAKLRDPRSPRILASLTHKCSV